MLAKRTLDLVLAVFLLVSLSPLLLGIALLVRARDGAPVLFRQVRVGRGGRTFSLVKFRTMRPEPGSLVTAGGDPRITSLGRVLRRFKVDELPQVLNVLLGDMSLVGPRPEVPAYVAQAPRGYRAIAELRPGLTDWASLAFRDEEEILHAHASDPGFYPRVVLPRKLALARLYHRKRSLGLDLSLIAATVALVVGLESVMHALVGPRLLARARAGLTA